jgi:hypothetical protein
MVQGFLPIVSSLSGDRAVFPVIWDVKAKRLIKYEQRLTQLGHSAEGANLKGIFNY